MGVALAASAYGKLCSKALPKIIEDDDELARMKAALEDLTFKASPTPEEDALAALLAKLIGDYEDEHHPIPEAAPHETLAFLMDQQGLKQADLLDIFGSRGLASEVCRGKRAISKAHARKLAERFHVPADVFL